MKQPFLTMEAVRMPVSLAAAGLAHLCMALGIAGHTIPRGPARTSAAEASVDLMSIAEDPDSQPERSGGPAQSTTIAPATRPMMSRGSLREAPSRSPVPRGDPSGARDADAAQERTSAGPNPVTPEAVSGNSCRAEEGAPDKEGAGAAQDVARPADGAIRYAAAGELAVRKPVLLPEPNLCGDIFPSGADCDRGVVTLSLRVTQSGDATELAIISEQPRGQGFARAAELCSKRLRFHPASDARGRPVAANSVVRLRFAR